MQLIFTVPKRRKKAEIYFREETKKKPNFVHKLKPSVDKTHKFYNS